MGAVLSPHTQHPRYSSPMGRVDVTVQISNLDGSQTREVEAMVDTGSTYTFVPASMLRDLGVVPTRRSRFRLANGGIVEYERGEARVRLNGFAVTTEIIFGDEDAAPLLGVVVLEQLELAVDPVGGKLIPLELTL